MFCGTFCSPHWASTGFTEHLGMLIRLLISLLYLFRLRRLKLNYLLTNSFSKLYVPKRIFDTTNFFSIINSIFALTLWTEAKNFSKNRIPLRLKIWIFIFGAFSLNSLSGVIFVQEKSNSDFQTWLKFP